MNGDFGFLAQAKPATLHKLLEKMSLEDAAAVLAGLPTSLSVQVMAYFPEHFQADLIPAMRDARKAPPEKARRTAEKIRETLMEAKRTRQAAGPPPAAPRPDKPPLAEKYAGSSPFGKPRPWTPRAAATSPINGPALPGGPEPVAGDPFRSPLAKAGLLDLIGRAREKLLPRDAAAGKKNPAKTPARPSAKAPAARPPAREGVLRSVKVGGTPRVIGPRAKPEDAPPSPGARRMDGKAILAAILRESDTNVRDNVRGEDPSLFRDLRKRMFYFDDLVLTDDRGLAHVFTVAPAAEAAVALKFAPPLLRERVLRAVSPGRAEALRDVGRVKGGFDAVEAAQKKVLDVALQLQAAGRILIDPRDPDLAKDDA